MYDGVPVHWNTCDKFNFVFLGDLIRVHVNDFFTGEPVLVRIQDPDVPQCYVDEYDYRWLEFKFPELEYIQTERAQPQILHMIKKLKKRKSRARDWGIVRLIKHKKRWALRMARANGRFKDGFYIDKFHIYTADRGVGQAFKHPDEVYFYSSPSEKSGGIYETDYGAYHPLDEPKKGFPPEERYYPTKDWRSND